MNRDIPDYYGDIWMWIKVRFWEEQGRWRFNFRPAHWGSIFCQTEKKPWKRTFNKAIPHMRKGDIVYIEGLMRREEDFGEARKLYRLLYPRGIEIRFVREGWNWWDLYKNRGILLAHNVEEFNRGEES